MPDRVLVAMSGGVDSSLAAALLMQQGCMVEGVTMKLSAGVCCDIASAQAVCSHLGIPHRVIDLQHEFEQSVVKDFVDQYRAGRTPNPCIRCNDVIKFQVLLSHALERGFDAVATGHYARIGRDDATGRSLLMKGLDGEKDQSYFLYRLTQDQLDHVLFPLGGLTKTVVRMQAKGLGLPAAARPESQEICFVPDNDYRSFLRERAPDILKRGDIVLTDGTVVGKHKGIAFFTVGQRRGVGVASGGRLYVVRIEPESGRVVLGQRHELDRAEFQVSHAHFLPFDRLAGERIVDVKVRYRSQLQRASIRPAEHGRVAITLERPVPGVTPGQSAVFYEGDVVVGGGIIEG